MWAKTFLLAAFVAASAFATPAVAQHRDRGPGIEPGWIMPAQERRENRQEIRPLREIVEGVRARFGGELISARLEGGPQPFYVLRWRMANNEVRDLRVDAVSGQIR